MSVAHSFVRVNNQNSKAYNDLYTITLALKEYMNVKVFKSGSTGKMHEFLNPTLILLLWPLKKNRPNRISNSSDGFTNFL